MEPISRNLTQIEEKAHKTFDEDERRKKQKSEKEKKNLSEQQKEFQ